MPLPPAYVRARKSLLDAIASGRYEDAVGGAQTWLAEASFADILELISSAPVQQQAGLIALIDDVFSGYPTPLYACPLLLHLDRAGHDERGVIALPDALSAPCENVSAVGWLPGDLARRSGALCDATGAGLQVETGVTSWCILTLRARDGEPPEVPRDEWFGELFMQVSDLVDAVDVAPTRVMSVLAAIEACRALAAGMAWETEGVSSRFLGAEGLAWALETGRNFARAHVDI